MKRRRPELSEASALEGIDFGAADPAATEGTHCKLDPIGGAKGFLRREQYAIRARTHRP